MSIGLEAGSNVSIPLLHSDSSLEETSSALEAGNSSAGSRYARKLYQETSYSCSDECERGSWLVGRNAAFKVMSVVGNALLVAAPNLPGMTCSSETGFNELYAAERKAAFGLIFSIAQLSTLVYYKCKGTSTLRKIVDIPIGRAKEKIRAEKCALDAHIAIATVCIGANIANIIWPLYTCSTNKGND